MTKKQKKWFIQKPIGIVFLLISYMIIKLATTGITPEDRDVTAILITIPLGLWMLFSKKYLLTI